MERRKIQGLSLNENVVGSAVEYSDVQTAILLTISVEAKSVFVDERAKLIDDPDHSDDEDRFVLLGLSGALRLLLVCHCYRGDGNVIRIISARKASTRKSKSYL